MYVNAIECKECEDIIYSRDRDDFRQCSCGRVQVSGDQKHFKYYTMPRAAYQKLKIKVNVSLQEMQDDFESMEDRYGRVAPENRTQVIL